MNTAQSERLYSPRLLSLATELAHYPLSDNFDLRGSARSTTCGSTLEIGLHLDDEAVIETLGLRAKSCAVGQASAAIFAGSAKGLRAQQIEDAKLAIESWLSGVRDLPTWPGFGDLVAARDYPARHAALLLPWRAAIDALSKA